MKTLVISRPVYDYILPLVEFPQDGDNFFIDKSIKTMSNFGSISAITLASFGIDVSFTGVVGEDDLGRKIKEIFNTHNVDTKYIETSYTENTCTNFKIYNSKTNKFTTIQEKSVKTNLMKYKYEFIPDVVVMDDGDYNANLAAINNYSNSKLIYIGEKFTKDSLIYCNKCNYVIANINFASEATGIVNNLNKPKTIVSLFQKYIDLYSSNLIIKLDNFDFLYLVNDEVRLIKNVNNNLINKDYIYYSVLIYYLINTNNIEESLKFTNKAMLTVNNDIDIMNSIPSFKDVNKILEDNKVINNASASNETSNNNLNSNQNMNSNANSDTNNINDTISNNQSIKTLDKNDNIEIPNIETLEDNTNNLNNGVSDA